METSTYDIGGMSCDGCVSKLSTALKHIPGVKSSNVEVGKAIIDHDGELNEEISAAIVSCGFTVGSDFSWSDSAVWKKSAQNTKWCLIGCSIGDFGTIASFQFVFTDSGWRVIGVSTDSAQSHQKFIDKNSLPFELIVDEDSSLHEAYGTWREKNMYGNTYMGTLRSTFVIDSNGILQWVRYKVSPKGHVDELLSDLGVV